MITMYFYVHEYHIQLCRPYINLLTWKYTGILHGHRKFIYSDMFFSEFLYDFECTIFDQPYRNAHAGMTIPVSYVHNYAHGHASA